jgi:hypothetical protein
MSGLFGGLEKKLSPQLETALGGPGYSFTCRHIILTTNENKHTDACKYKKMGFSKKESNKDIQSVSNSFSFGTPANNIDIPELS